MSKNKNLQKEKKLKHFIYNVLATKRKSRAARKGCAVSASYSIGLFRLQNTEKILQ